MDTPQAPAAPDPVKTAQAQTESNKQTAISQYELGASNQNTPGGSLSYKQIGTWEDGTPRFEATQSYSPGQQQIYDTNQKTQQNVAQIGADQSASLGSLLSKPFSYQNLPSSVTNVQGQPITSSIANAGDIQKSIGPTDYSADRTKVEDAINSRLNPQLDRDTAALQTQLINKGLRPGTEAWTQAIDADNRSRNDARQQTILSGGQEQSRLAGLALQSGNFANSAQAQQYSQNANDASFGNQAQAQDFAQGLTNANLSNSQRSALAQQQLTERNQPINEITALMSGSQVSNPSYVNTPTPGVAPTDVIGAQQQSLNQQNVGFNAQQQQNQALMNGLFGLGGAGLKAASGGGSGLFSLSDITAKENIDIVGERPDGLHVIDYEYKPEVGLGDERQRGLIAQEVAQVYPDSVARRRDGKLAVNYASVPGTDLFAMGAHARRSA